MKTANPNRRTNKAAKRSGRKGNQFIGISAETAVLGAFQYRLGMKN
jgi:hypothetical protein